MLLSLSFSFHVYVRLGHFLRGHCIALNNINECLAEKNKLSQKVIRKVFTAHKENVIKLRMKWNWVKWICRLELFVGK